MPARKKEPARCYSPDVTERETLDGGFSRGWGLHFPASEEYWLDCHTHFRPGRKAAMDGIMNRWFGHLDGFRLGGMVGIVDETKFFKACSELEARDPRFHWMCWLKWNAPDADLLDRALKLGARGLKLHNHMIMRGEGKADDWLGRAWAPVFKRLEKARLPVLWHVTQRVSFSPYHGGGLNAYWSEGQAKGIKLNNEDLLAIFLELADRYPGIPFVGAHQLYLGLERLDSIFRAHRNVYIDSSVGYYCRWADTIAPEDRETLNRFFRRWPDRVLFGSDSGLGADNIDEYLYQGFLCHARFFLQLGLPHEVLQKIAHENTEKLFRIEPVPFPRRGNVRP